MSDEGALLDLGIRSPEFRQQFWRTLGYVWSGCADVAECFATAAAIADGDLASWSAAWRATAAQVQADAQDSLRRGHRVSARDGYLRAAEYHRQGIWFLREDPGDPALRQGLRDMKACFGAAAELSDPPIRPVEIPFEGGSLPGWLYHGEPAGRPRPTLLVPGGYDSFSEEMYAMLGHGARRRGYAMLCFDGPGQGTALVERGLFMRPDFETVLAPVLDWLLQQPQVDPARVALCGFSLGGYLAPRAACTEHRIAALVANPGQVSPGAALPKRLPPAIAAMWRDGDRAGVDAAFAGIFAHDPMKRFFFRSRMAVHGLTSPFDWCTEMQRYTLADRIGGIACPTLVLDNPGDTVSAVGCAFYDGLSCDKTLLPMDAARGYGAHCQAGAIAHSERAIFDWLDERFRI